MHITATLVYLPVQVVVVFSVYDYQISYLLRDLLTPPESHLSELALQIAFEKESRSYPDAQV